jgi:cytosine/adenosine deaminase-related metal-dependent hydrolase
MVAKGVNVALGTDGAPCNNTYDMFREIHLASILHGGVRQKAGVLSAYDVLEFATINGARALGLEAEIGSLKVGKKADIVVVDPKSASCTPWDSAEQSSGGMDPVTVLVHSSGANVDTVIVDGRLLVSNGNLLHINEDEIIQKAKKSVADIRKRSGVGARNHMSLKYI